MSREVDTTLLVAVTTVLQDLFRRFGLDVPRVHHAFESDVCDYTNPTDREIRINTWTAPEGISPFHYAAHLFGHYLGDLHESQPDVVADIIAAMLEAK